MGWTCVWRHFPSACLARPAPGGAWLLTYHLLRVKGWQSLYLPAGQPLAQGLCGQNPLPLRLWGLLCGLSENAVLMRRRALYGLPARTRARGEGWFFQVRGSRWR